MTKKQLKALTSIINGINELRSQFTSDKIVLTVHEKSYTGNQCDEKLYDAYVYVPVVLDLLVLCNILSRYSSLVYTIENNHLLRII